MKSLPECLSTCSSIAAKQPPNLDLWKVILLKSYLNLLMQMQIKLGHDIFYALKWLTLLKVTSNRKNLILKWWRKEREKSWKLGNFGPWSLLWWNTEEYVFHKKLKMRRMQTSSTPSSSEITCKLKNTCTKMVKSLVPPTTETWKTLALNKMNMPF